MNVTGELWKRVVGEFFFDDFFYNGGGGVVDKYQVFYILFYIMRPTCFFSSVKKFVNKVNDWLTLWLRLWSLTTI